MKQNLTLKHTKLIKIVLILLTAFVLVAGSIIAFMIGNKLDSEEQKISDFEQAESLYFMGLDEQKQIGKVNSIIEYGDFLSHVIKYPTIGKTEIDNQIHDIITNIHNNFNTQYGVASEQNKNHTYRLFLSYETYLAPENKMSFVVIEQVETDETLDSKTKTYTYNFDLSTGKKLDSSDIFKSDYKETVSVYLLKYLEATYKNDLSSDYKIHNSASDQNLNQYALTNDGIKFYFDKSTIILHTCGAIGVTVPYDSMQNCLLYNMNKKAEIPAPNIGSLAEITPPKQQKQNSNKHISESNNNNNSISSSNNNKITTAVSGQPMVALTFDDGPNPISTARILDILEKNNAVATFFDLGSLIDTYPAIVRREEQSGCEVESHTYDHKNLNGLSPSQIQSEIDKTNDAFMRVLGHKAALVRPPYGNANKTVCSTIKYPLINWSVDTVDWKSRNSSKIIDEINKIGNLNGKIILMHSIYGSTADAVEKIVPELKSKGYQLVTISQLAKARSKGALKAGVVYTQFK